MVLLLTVISNPVAIREVSYRTIIPQRAHTLPTLDVRADLACDVSRVKGSGVKTRGGHLAPLSYGHPSRHVILQARKARMEL